MSTSPITSQAKRKAIAATALFTIGLIIGTQQVVTDWKVSLPLILFNALFIYHAYYSIRLFSSIIPAHNRRQQGIDMALALFYLALPWTLNNATNFMLLGAIMLATAAIKYTAMLNKIPYPKTLRRKIIADTLGVLLCLATLIGIVQGYELAATVGTTAVFLLASVHYMGIHPLYKSID